jgi:hypothetical protein
MKVDVSNGELLDKITILQIKKLKIKDVGKLKNIENELSYLLHFLPELVSVIGDSMYRSLYDINLKLWEIEDAIRIKEINNSFDVQFIELARSVYTFNDERAEIKYKINKLTKSKLVEEKDYSKKNN